MAQHIGEERAGGTEGEAEHQQGHQAGGVEQGDEHRHNAHDSHNDLGMIRASKAGFLFKSTEQIKKDNPDLPAFETYDELLAAIKKAL